MLKQQKQKLQKGNLRIYNQMWLLKELRSNRLTYLNKEKVKDIVFKDLRRK